MRLPFFLASRFVAAETLDEALPVVHDLHDQGLHVALDLLGEYVSDVEEARHNRDAYVQLVRRLGRERPGGEKLHTTASIKLSAMGQKVDRAFCLKSLRQLLEEAQEHDVFVRLDMEGSDVTQSTLDLFEEVYPDFPDHVGPVLQAYLHRTERDVARMCELNARVRLCKGAYNEPPSIAYKDMHQIRERFAGYMEALLEHARYPGIATHDDTLIEATKRFAADRGIGPERFEFQMLYGLRPETQVALAEEGYNMLVYVPYGTEWFPYYSRRLRERKENVWFILKNLLRR